MRQFGVSGQFVAGPECFFARPYHGHGRRTAVEPHPEGVWVIAAQLLCLLEPLPDLPPDATSGFLLFGISLVGHTELCRWEKWVDEQDTYRPISRPRR